MASAATSSAATDRPRDSVPDQRWYVVKMQNVSGDRPALEDCHARRPSWRVDGWVRKAAQHRVCCRCLLFACNAARRSLSLCVMVNPGAPLVSALCPRTRDHVSQANSGPRLVHLRNEVSVLHGCLQDATCLVGTATVRKQKRVSEHRLQPPGLLNSPSHNHREPLFPSSATQPPPLPPQPPGSRPKMLSEPPPPQL